MADGEARRGCSIVRAMDGNTDRMSCLNGVKNIKITNIN